MSLSNHYKAALQQPNMVYDAAQARVINHLEAIDKKLNKPNVNPLLRFLKHLSPLAKHKKTPVQGIYIWGDVGRGKTWLMNMFYEELLIKEKSRIHFHHFMLSIHEQLVELNKHQSKKRKNPLQHIAKSLAKQNKVLCIDEFIVTNITDAMILSELLRNLFKHGVCLVATSNRVPDDLYLNGLQRDRFLPAIKLIKSHMKVFHLDDGIDHRVSLLEKSNIYYCPVSETTQQKISQKMQEIAITPVINKQALRILNRDIQTIKCSEEIAWFEFEALCTTPRAAQDYIALALRFNTIIISNIPVMDEYSDDKARRFIYLIDELYDRNVKLIASALAQPENIYQGQMLKFAFHRTSSRLIEMRSHQYLSQTHKAF